MRKKTSISIDKKLWKDWIIFVLTKTGSVRKLSEELEIAMKNYMEDVYPQLKPLEGCNPPTFQKRPKKLSGFQKSAVEKATIRVE